MDYMYSGLILVVDLESGEVEEVDLEEEFIQENIGGAAANLALYEEYKDKDPIIFGSGFFTGTLISGSALGIVTAKSPVTGEVAHAPIAWFFGPELKLSGYDFVVVCGKSEKPVYLWLHDEMADVKDAAEVWGKNTWETTDFLRNELGDDRVQVLTVGKAGENRVRHAQLVNNYWCSGDKFGFGAIFGEKNVKALALRGMGELELEDPDAFLEKDLELLEKIKAEIMGKNVEQLAESAGVNIEGLEPFIHRHTACFNCPFPCRPYVKYNEVSTVMASSRVKEPGVLISDLYGLATFSKKLDMETSLRAIEKCCRVGIDPVVAGTLIKNSELDDVIREIDSMVPAESDTSGIKPWGKEVDYGTFGSFCPPLTDDWKDKVALGYTLGICPILLSFVSELSKEVLVEIINITTGWEISTDDLDSAVSKLL
ncbi:MAG: aldehyde ferredoxin oxidoreductase N-terminal domain-containing protein [Halobacteriota archaeon]|nr:aldehyde ferredoxin oxidoreductase N-terminal domain-containing protein [Halobacteriota archaeon]